MVALPPRFVRGRLPGPDGEDGHLSAETWHPSLCHNPKSGIREHGFELAANRELVHPKQPPQQPHNACWHEVSDEPPATRSQDPLYLGNALSLVAPMVEGHGAKHQVEPAVWKWKGLRGRLPELNAAAGGSGGLSLADHLSRRVDALQRGAWESSLSGSEQPPCSATDIQNGLRACDLCSGEVKGCLLHRFEHEALQPVAVIGRRPAVEAVDIVPVSHGIDRRPG